MFYWNPNFFEILKRKETLCVELCPSALGEIPSFAEIHFRELQLAVRELDNDSAAIFAFADEWDDLAIRNTVFRGETDVANARSAPRGSRRRRRRSIVRRRLSGCERSVKIK